MFRRIKKFVWRSRGRMLSLVMLPAFFLGTLPHTACICADGHREEFCKAALCRALGNGSKTTACCGCSCCKPSGSHAGRSCCQSKQGESGKPSSMPMNGLAAKTNSCCQPIIEAPAPASQSSKVEVVDQLSLVAAVASLLLLVPTVDIRPSFDHIHSATPPPLDAVIVFLHLTI